MITEATRSRPAAPEVGAEDESRHGPVAQLLIAWSPLSAILVSYWVAQWVTGALGAGVATNRVGAPLHVVEPARADERIFGTVPMVWPWLASERGDIGDVARISHVGWDVLHLGVVGRLTEAGQSGSNPVAAMPSVLVATVARPAGYRRSSRHHQDHVEEKA